MARREGAAAGQDELDELKARAARKRLEAVTDPHRAV